jgi:outer membrane protein OmpA-like peptidoglycan-associated protein
MARNYFSTLFVLAIVVTGMTLTGCKSVPVDILSMSAPDSLLTNESGTFAVATNLDAKQPVNVGWSFGDNNSANGSSSTHSFATAGTYTVKATATNRKGKSTDVESTSVVVSNPPVPAAIVSLKASNMSPDTQTDVSFTASVNGDEPLAYSWKFGDGGSSSSASPSHTFDSPGSYTVSLETSNKFGSDSRSLSLTVSWYEAAICREVTELSTILFSRNSSTLSDEATAAMGENLEILNECPNMNVRVEGLAAPGERRAQALSEDRARAVEQYYGENGVTAGRIVSVGNGRAKDLTSKKEGLSQYRRVDTIILR